MVVRKKTAAKKPAKAVKKPATKKVQAKAKPKAKAAAKPAAKKKAAAASAGRAKTVKKRVSAAASAALKAFAKLAGKATKAVRGRKLAAKPARKPAAAPRKPAAAARKTVAKRVASDRGSAREHRPLKLAEWSWSAPLPKKPGVAAPIVAKPKREKDRRKRKKRIRKLGFIARQRELKLRKRARKAAKAKAQAAAKAAAAAPVIPGPAPAAAQPARRKPYMDWGLPIPDQYGTDRLQAMVRDPEWVYVYWEMAGGRLKGLRRQFGEGLLGSSSWHLLGREPRARQPRFRAQIDPRRGNYYCRVNPDTALQFVLLLRLPDGREIEVLVSNVVRTPRLTPSANTDEQWYISEEEFGKFLEGYEPPVGSRGRPSFPGFAFTLPSSGGSRR